MYIVYDRTYVVRSTYVGRTHIGRMYVGRTYVGMTVLRLGKPERVRQYLIEKQRYS